MNRSSPVVWVLLGHRSGDNAQALELARRVGGQIVEKQLVYNHLAGAPNWMTGAGFGTLATSAREMLQPPWPDLVIAAGRKTARVSLAIKRASANRTKVVQIGRPRFSVSRFDLVVTTPQYGLPSCAGVLELPLPFAVPQTVAPAARLGFERLWSTLPRPWLVAVIGASKFPMRLGTTELDRFAAGLDALAKRLGSSLILIDSPRSQAGALGRIATRVSVPHWRWQRGTGDNPYQAALALGDVFAVTSDSVSMASELVQTGKPTYVHHLALSAFAPRWSAKSGIGAVLARRGLLMPPRDVQGFMLTLDRAGWIGDLVSGRAPRHIPDLNHVFDQAVAETKALLSI